MDDKMSLLLEQAEKRRLELLKLGSGELEYTRPMPTAILKNTARIIGELEDKLAVSYWRDAREILPEGSDRDGVLVAVTGRYDNITFEDALLIGEYDDIEGWLLREYPEWDRPGVTHWMPLPPPPGGEK